MERNSSRVLIDLAINMGAMFVATFVGFIFEEMNILEANIIMVYILAVVVIAKYSKTRWGGLIGSVLGVVLFNYFFTYPYYSLQAESKEYPITFLIMFMVAIITTTLTEKLKRETENAKEREAYTQKLYEASNKLLQVKNLEDAKRVSTTHIAHFLGKSVLLFCVDENQHIEDPLYEDEEDHINESFRDRIVIKNILAQEEKYYNEVNHTSYIPVKGHEGILAIVGIRNFNYRELSEVNETLLETFMAQISMVFEREYIANKQQQLQLTIESEKLRSSMLRSISHDLRTPLTGIVGATSSLIENHQNLEEEVKMKLLKDVYEDAIWLNHSVENILNITRIDEGRLVIAKQIEVAEEIIESILNHMNKYLKKHRIQISLDEEVILVPMDASLMVQVLYNVLDNAIKHTPEQSQITIKVYKQGEYALFEVEDNGEGIPEKYIDNIFERFYDKKHLRELEQKKRREGRVGIGIGLSICKDIVEAHDGEISIFNNELGGTTVRIKLPIESGEDSGE